MIPRPIEQWHQVVKSRGLRALQELLAEDVKEAAMAETTAATIWRPIQVAIEAFDAALAGRRPGERQGTIVHTQEPPGRNEPCPCGSGKKFKKCHGA